MNVKIQRIDGLPLTSGKCENATNANDPSYGNFSVILATPRRYVLMLPSVCMEKDVSYVVQVTYSREESNTDGADTILTDSVSSRVFIRETNQCNYKFSQENAANKELLSRLQFNRISSVHRLKS